MKLKKETKPGAPGKRAGTRPKFLGVIATSDIIVVFIQIWLDTVTAKSETLPVDFKTK